MKDTGKKQYNDFIKNVLDVRSHSIHDPVKRNSIALFSKPKCKATSQQEKKIKVLQNNVAFFDLLYISMQNRDGDLSGFFVHEIQTFPLSLSDFGKLHLPNTKSDLLKYIEDSNQPDPPSIYDCKVLDCDAIVHYLPTTSVSIFHEHADRIFIHYLEKQVSK